MREKQIRTVAFDYVNKLCPDMIHAKIQINANLLVLGLKMKYFPKLTERIIIIHDFDTTVSKNDLVIECIKENIKKAILSFGKDQCNTLIDEFDLHSFYKARYEDTNILYKIRKKYERKINRGTVTKNLSFYLYDEIKVSFIHLFYFWIQLVKMKIDHTNYDEIMDMTYSIIEHIKQLFFVFHRIEDIIREALHLGNPDVFFLLYHYLGSFISLAKTVSDNLAWILVLYLELNLDYRFIDLFGNKLSNFIKIQDRHLFNIIYKRGYFEEYKKLVTYRDIIQHRHIIKSMRVVRIEDHQNLILLPKDPEKFLSSQLRAGKGSSNESESQYKIAENVNSIIRFGLHEYNYISNSNILKDYISPMQFCNFHIHEISVMLNEAFERITDCVARKLVAKVTKFYSRILVAEMYVNTKLEIGDEILIEGKTTSFKQRVQSIELNHKRVRNIDKGLCALVVNQIVRKNDKVYLITKVESSALRYWI